MKDKHQFTINSDPIFGDECNLSDADYFCYTHKSYECWKNELAKNSYLTPNSPTLLDDVSMYYDAQMPEPRHQWGSWHSMHNYDAVYRECGKCNIKVQITGQLLGQQSSAVEAAKTLEHVWTNIEPQTCNPLSPEDQYLDTLQKMFPGATVVLDENAPKNKIYVTDKDAYEAHVLAHKEFMASESPAFGKLTPVPESASPGPDPDLQAMIDEEVEKDKVGKMPPELTDGAFDVIQTWMNTPYWSFKQDNNIHQYWEMVFVIHLPLPTGKALNEGETFAPGSIAQQFYSILVRRVPIALQDDRWWMETAVRQDTGEPILTVNHKGSYQQYLGEIQGEPF